MDDLHNDVIDEVKSQVAQQNEQKMIGKRLGLPHCTVDSEGNVHSVGWQEDHHAIQVTWTREDAVLLQQAIQMNLRRQTNGTG